MALRGQSHLRLLTTLVATAMTAALPNACGSNGGSPGDAGRPDDTGSSDDSGGDGSSASSGSSSGSDASPEAGDDSAVSGSSSGADSGSSSSSASGTSSGGYCPPTMSYTIDPNLCDFQLLSIQTGACWTFENPCSADDGGLDDGAIDASTGSDAGTMDPCSVCTTMVDGSVVTGAPDAAPSCYTMPATQKGGLIVVCGGCCLGGRAPRGFAPRRAVAASARAARLAQMAQVEAASVPAFRALHADLVRLRAPRRILSAVRAAARDEVRHARAVGRAAERFGARVPRVRVEPIAPRSLEQLAIDNAREGCVMETFGAAVAAVQARRATDGAVRCLMRIIAREELRHAALAWDIARWLEARLDRAGRARVRRARFAALKRLEGELASLGTGDPVLGLPDASSSAALLERMWQPLRRGLLAPDGSGANRA